MKTDLAHNHPINSGHGAFNRFVVDCPACDKMKARRDAAALQWKAILAKTQSDD